MMPRKKWLLVTGPPLPLSYADVAQTAPTSAVAQAGWARALVYANKPADAVEHAQKAADLEPKSAEFQAPAGAGIRLVWQSRPCANQRSTGDGSSIRSSPTAGPFWRKPKTDKFRLKEAGDAPRPRHGGWRRRQP